MSSKRRRSVALTVLSILCAYSPPSSRAQDRPRLADEEAIRRIIAATTDAFNQHDADVWTTFCTPDARLVTVRGEYMQGVEGIEHGLRSIFETRGKNATLTARDLRVTFIKPDVALVHVTNEMSGIVGPDAQTMPPHTELSLRVLVREGDAWRIAAFHNTIVER